jgi:hypothetical protein
MILKRNINRYTIQTNYKKVEVAMLIPNKVEFRKRDIINDK